jgi:RimJ/RimL family protein N-acetyltransferase
MTTAAPFSGEYEALAAWTQRSVEDLRREEEHHEGPRQRWLAWDGDDVVGVMRPWVRPDARNILYFGPCKPGSYAVLAAEVSGECFTTIDAADEDAFRELASAGFHEHRRESYYEIPVTAFEAPLPDGIAVISAADTTLDDLMALDCALRGDVPGADGWQPDPQWFREETYDSPYFDPQTYLVAVAPDGYAGLVRIWNGPRPLPRLGLVGVLPAYRRRGLATAMLARAFAPLVARGERLVTAEVDMDNVASNALARGLGGKAVGSAVELRRARG